MKIIGILQNQWYKDPQRVAATLARLDAKGQRRFRTFALFQSATGRKLKAAFGDLCHQIIWENASDVLAAHPSDRPRPNHIQLAIVLAYEQPQIILVFGSIAKQTLVRSFTAIIEELRPASHIITGPHPANRTIDTRRRLAEMNIELRNAIRLIEPASSAKSVAKDSE